MNFTSENLRKLLRLNYFPYSETKPMIFGIRGASPANTNCDTFKSSHAIIQTNVDYKNPRCLLGIWQPLENKIALFPGSTVPNIMYIKKQVAKLAKSNCIQSGYYSYYEKGFHYPSEDGKHEALRLATNIFLRRTLNDLVFTNTDPIEVANPNDNIHAAYCNDTKSGYSSAGCQVIVGQPKCKRRGNKPNTGYWKSFYDYIYAMSQTQFDYTLFRYADAEAVSNAQNNQMETRLRFGSEGYKVLELQTKLRNLGYFNTSEDGEFKKNTLEAVLKFQTDNFGEANADGVVGSGTAGKLGLTLNMI